MNRLIGSRIVVRQLTRLIILVALSATAVSGCGQKGPLYRPGTQQTQANQ